MLDDPELADVLAAQEETGPTSGPSLSGFSAEISLLTLVCDRLGELISVQVALAGRKAPKVTPLPRPSTGVDRARERIAARRHTDLVDEVKAAQERWAAGRLELERTDN